MIDRTKWSVEQLQAMKARCQAKVDGYREAAQIMREHAQVCEEEADGMSRQLVEVRDELVRRRDFGHTRKVRPWFLEGLLRVGDVAVLCDEVKSFKSWHAFDLAVAAISGQPWLGFHCKGVDRVAFLTGHGTSDYFAQRVGMLCAGRGLLAKAQEISQRITIVDSGCPQHTLTLGNARNAIAGKDRYGLVIVDTMIEALAGPVAARYSRESFVEAVRILADGFECPVVCVQWRPTIGADVGVDELINAFDVRLDVRSRIGKATHKMTMNIASREIPTTIKIAYQLAFDKFRESAKFKVKTPA
jgi:RecA-family ATPase